MSKHAIISFGWNNSYAVPISKTSQLLTILEDSIQVDGGYLDNEYVYYTITNNNKLNITIAEITYTEYAFNVKRNELAELKKKQNENE